MIDIFLGENDGGSLVIDNQNDISTTEGIESYAYNLLVRGFSPLDVQKGRKKEDLTEFENLMNNKVSISNINAMKQAAERQLKPMISEKIASSYVVSIKNTVLERLEVIIDFVLPNDTKYSTKILTIENGEIV